MLQRVQAWRRILVGSSLVVIAIMGFGRSAPPQAATLAGAPFAPAGQQPVATTSKPIADDLSIEARARETEQKMTDDERFGLIHSLMVVVLRKDFSQERDSAFPPTCRRPPAG